MAKRIEMREYYSTQSDIGSAGVLPLRCENLMKEESLGTNSSSHCHVISHVLWRAIVTGAIFRIVFPYFIFGAESSTLITFPPL